MDIVRGTRVRGYEFEHPLGSGAFGVVYLARQVETGEPVAIKVLHESVASDAEMTARFKREARLLTRIQSPHVAKMIDVITDPALGMLLVMEYVEGELLSDVAAAGTMSVEEALALGIDLAAALVDMHASGVLHRDIKPANVMMVPRAGGGRRAVMLDFGLGRRMTGGDQLANFEGATGDERSVTLTAAHVAIGTPEFMAPEQILNARDAKAQSDIYAVGAVLYRVVAGAPAYEGSATALARAKLTTPAKPLHTFRQDAVAVKFEAVVAKALRLRIAERHATARELHEELTALQRSRAEIASRAQDLTARAVHDEETRLSSQKGRSLVTYVLVVLATAALVFGVYFGLLRR